MPTADGCWSIKENQIMRIARKLTLLAMLAIAATALAAPSAFAQTEPLAHNQTPLLIVQQEVHGAVDANCPLVTPSPPPNPGPLVTAGGCRTHASAPNVQLFAHLSAGGTEVLVSTCNVEFDIRIDAAGEGYLSHQEFTQGTAGTCTQKVCGQVTPPTSEGRAYSFFMRETEPAPTERATALFCTEPLDGSSPPAHCEVTVPVTEPTPHAYRFTAADVSGHGAIFPHCELGSAASPAQFNTEAVLGTTGEAQAEQELEIRHN
jgi:hypothetical protein